MVVRKAADLDENELRISMNAPGSTTPPRPMEETVNSRDLSIALGLALVTVLIFYFSIKPTQQHFDYTPRIASQLLEGHLGFTKEPPSWLNEMVPVKGYYYSVFPLGAVVSMLPVAILQKLKLIHDFPGR